MNKVAKLLGVTGKNIANDISSFCEEMIRSEMELDELVSVYSEPLDTIIEEEMSRGNNYVGGEFKVSCLSSKYFELSFELYFQNPDKQWIKREGRSKPQSMTYFTRQAATELKEKESISFEIDPPSEKPIKAPVEKTVTIRKKEE